MPSTEFGGTCQCAGFVFEPSAEASPPEPKLELLDGPAMYAEALGYLRIARRTGGGAHYNQHIERYALEHAAIYFAGATAAAIGAVVADNGTGDLAERRWWAALTGEAELPEDDQS